MNKTYLINNLQLRLIEKRLNLSRSNLEVFNKAIIDYANNESIVFRDKFDKKIDIICDSIIGEELTNDETDILLEFMENENDRPTSKIND